MNVQNPIVFIPCYDVGMLVDVRFTSRGKAVPWNNTFFTAEAQR